MEAKVLSDKIIVGDVIIDEGVIEMLRYYQEEDCSGSSIDIEILQEVQRELFEVESNDSETCVRMMHLLKRIHYMMERIKSLNPINREGL